MKQLFILCALLVLPLAGMAQGLTKSRQVGEDGFIWYLTEKNGKYGVMDTNGNEIIPAKYSWVRYAETSEAHYFRVQDGDFVGAYTRLGTMIVSPDRHYTYVWIGGGKQNTIYCMVEKNGDTRGLLDARGNEVISLDRGYTFFMIFESDKGKKLYIQVERGDYEGICDMNGKEIVAPEKYKKCYLYTPTEVFGKFADDTEEDVPLGFTYSDATRYSFRSYDNLHEKDTKNYPTLSSSGSSSGSSSSGGSSSSSSGGSVGPVEYTTVQVWQSCGGCGGDGVCKVCYGSGWSMNGKHLCITCNGYRQCRQCNGRGGQYVNQTVPRY